MDRFGPRRSFPDELFVDAHLENFIASTSIFVCMNSKLLRVNGGCLGDKNR